MSAPKIIWLGEPITEEEILTSARIFRDPNIVHRCPEGARKHFGNDAIGIVAPGAQVLGIVGGEIARQYGDGTVAHCLSNIKLQRCFCPGDSVGVRISVDSDVVKCALRFVHFQIEVFRLRDGEVTPACRKGPITAEIAAPPS